VIASLTKLWQQLPAEVSVQLQNPRVFLPVMLHFEDILNQGKELQSLVLNFETLTYSNMNSFKQNTERKTVLQDLQIQEIISNDWIPLSYLSHNLVGTQFQLGTSIGLPKEATINVSYRHTPNLNVKYSSLPTDIQLEILISMLPEAKQIEAVFKSPYAIRSYLFSAPNTLELAVDKQLLTCVVS
jgi:hypothetical protein